MTKPLALAYVRVSTAAQVETGSSLDAQEATLLAEAERRGWDVEIIREEGKSAKSITGRDKLMAALDRLDDAKDPAQVLLSVRLDRISRSVADFAGLLDRAARKSWSLVLLSPNIDTSDAAGRFTSNVLASAAQYERELIGVRTREGLAQVRADGTKLGRPVRLSRELHREIIARASTESMSAIARSLTERGEPTAQGGKRWYPSTVQAVLRSETAKALSV